MYYILEKLHSSPLVKDLEIREFIDEEEVQVLSCRAVLKDDSALYIRETVTREGSRYSYHWQDKGENLIIRWDNAPHYPEIATAPHHKHLGSKKDIAPSQETTFEDIFEVISKKLKS